MQAVVAQQSTGSLAGNILKRIATNKGQGARIVLSGDATNTSVVLLEKATVTNRNATERPIYPQVGQQGGRTVAELLVFASRRMGHFQRRADVRDRRREVGALKREATARV